VEDTQTGNLQTYVIESFDPVYNTNTNTLTYTIVGENETIDLPKEFGQSVLVIDMKSGEKIDVYTKGNSVPLCGKFQPSPAAIATRCDR
jgi:hypothetical protein